MTAYLTPLLLAGILALVAAQLRTTTLILLSQRALHRELQSGRQSLGHLFDAILRVETAIQRIGQDQD